MLALYTFVGKESRYIYNSELKLVHLFALVLIFCDYAEFIYVKPAALSKSSIVSAGVNLRTNTRQQKSC